MTEPHHTAGDCYIDEDDGEDKPVRVPIVLKGTHARLVTGLRRARSERISVILTTAVYFCLSSWNKIRWVSVLLDIASWLATLNPPIIKTTIQMMHKRQAVLFLRSADKRILRLFCSVHSKEMTLMFVMGTWRWILKMLSL